MVKVHKRRFLRKGLLESSTYAPSELYLEYVPSRFLLDWTSLNSYLDSYRSWSGTAEAAVAQIVEDLRHAIVPGEVFVSMRFHRDAAGGYRYEVKSV